MINSFNNFYNNLSSDSLFFFWIIIFLFIFLVVISIILINKNKKLVKILKEEQEKVEDNKEINNNILKQQQLEVPVETKEVPLEEPTSNKEEEKIPVVKEEIKEVQEEVKENNISIWLIPACNIHRSPLCGRNFEYYSEDPYLAGKTGAAMVRGIQSQHIGASVKHFAANNKETNRKDSDSRVSERALREIYLKQFEIIVKEAHPYTIMSSYNLINGIHASENKELLTGILRDEWGFDGLVTTDWWTFGEHYRETKAGNDIKMAAGYPERIKEAYEKGFITEAEIRLSARRILNMILKID